MVAAIVEVLDRHATHDLDARARGGEAFEGDLIEALAGDAAVGESRRGAQRLDAAVADAPVIPAMGDRGLERVWHQIEETPRPVGAAQGLAWIDEQDSRVIRQGGIQQCHREGEPGQARTRDDHIGVDCRADARLSHMRSISCAAAFTLR